LARAIDRAAEFAARTRPCSSTTNTPSPIASTTWSMVNGRPARIPNPPRSTQIHTAAAATNTIGVMSSSRSPSWISALIWVIIGSATAPIATTSDHRSRTAWDNAATSTASTMMSSAWLYRACTQ
jgi:hypothetical protein